MNKEYKVDKDPTGHNIKSDKKVGLMLKKNIKHLSFDILKASCQQGTFEPPRRRTENPSCFV